MKTNELDTIAEDRPLVVGPKTVAVPLYAVGALFAFLVTATIGGGVPLVIWGAKMSSDVSTIKSSILRLNEIDTIKASISALQVQVNSIERRGSEPMQTMQRSLDKLAEDLRVHSETDKIRKQIGDRQ